MKNKDDTVFPVHHKDEIDSRLVDIGIESQPSSCHSQGLIDEVISESKRLQHVTHLPHAWGLLLAQYRHWYKSHQTNVSSKRHPVKILLMNVSG